MIMRTNTANTNSTGSATGTTCTPRRRVAAAAVGLMMLAAVGATACSPDEQAGCPPLALAFLGVLTGPDASSGTTVRNSAALAVKEHNVATPQCEIGLISYDSQGDADQAEVLARQIVADDQIIGVVGPVFSGETAAAMPIFEQAGLPVLTPSATNPTLSAQGWTTFHRLVGTDDAQGPAAILWLLESGDVKRVGVVDDGTLFGKALADFATDELNRRGITIAPRQQVEPSRRDYGDVVQAITSVGVDAVFFGGLGEAGAQLHRQLRDAGVSGLFVGGDGLYSTSFIEAVVAGPDGGVSVMVSCPCAGSAATDEQVAFGERYRSTYTGAALYFAFEGFDAASMLLAGIDSGARTRSALQQWLGTAEYQGLSKTISFKDNGDVVGGPVFINRIVDGSFKTVARVSDGRVTPVG
jgi:branched-chain amino acid transport system substrate-binding protein